MSVLYAVILGIVQGITEFIPVSSFGHICMLEGLFAFQRGPGVLFETMLHVGTLAAVILAFKKDVVQILKELTGIAKDVAGNIRIQVQNRRTGQNTPYKKVIYSSYRKFTVLILVALIPTAAIGYTARRLAVLAAVSPLVYGAGLLISGITLLVVDFSRSGGTKTLRDAGYSSAMWMGICQGISVFPGFSRSGLTISAALFCGLSRSFAVKFSYLMSIPAILGAMLLEVGNFTATGMTVGMGFTFLLGAVVAGITGYFVIRFLLKLLIRKRLCYFAYYCFAAGIFALIANYLF